MVVMEVGRRDGRKRCEGNSNLQAMLVVVREGVSREANLSLSYGIIPYFTTLFFSAFRFPPPPQRHRPPRRPLV